MEDLFVKKKDFELFAADQTSQHDVINKTLKSHGDILVKLEPLSELVPYLKESADLKKATDKFVGSWKGRARTATIFIGLIAVLASVFISLRHLIIDLFYSQR